MRRVSLLALIAAACSRISAPPPPPSPASVQPAAGYARRDTPVLLHGDGFVPSVVQELGSGSRISVDAQFQAFLGNNALSGVRFIDTHTLAATVPAGLTAGLYDLTLVGPYGSGLAAGVYQVENAAPAALSATAAAPSRALVGSDVAIAVTVSNVGGMPALGVTASPAIASGPATTLQAPPEVVDIAPGAAYTFTWHAQASATGILDLSLPFAGIDQVDASAVGAQASASISIVTPAHLTVVSLKAPASQPAGPVFQISADLMNDGGSDALAVQFNPLAAPPFVTVVSAPDPIDIPAGATRTFVWTLQGTAEGTATLGASASALDATGGAAFPVGPMQWTVIIFRAVALLDPTLSVPPGALPNETFTVALTIDNPGIVDAQNVQATITVSGSGGVTLLSQSSPPPPVTVPAGGSAVFSWTYSADVRGNVQFDVSAAGTDARTGNPVTASATGTTAIADAAPVASDPFGDGASFAYVFPYAGHVYLGPSANGASAVRVLYDGTGAQTVRFGFETDFGNIKNTVSPTPTAFPTLGYNGCTPDTLECGPDNEDGRGLFTAVVINGTEWLFAAGSRQSSLLKHVYLTTDTGTTPQFPFVGINVSGGTRGTTAAAAMGNTLYVGFADAGGSGTPVLLKMTGLPGNSTQPLNPSLSTVFAPSTLNSKGTGLVDSMIAFNGWLYAANDGSSVIGNAGGCSRYNGSSWTSCTPGSAAWTAKAPIVTTKSSDFVPSDKAVPAMAVSGGRLYLARNTTTGPQLWSCNPSSNVCGTGNEWSLVVQPDPATLPTISLLAATSQHVYVGYDAPAGIQLFRSADATPSASTDFTAVAQPGLDAALTRIVDGHALSLGAKEFLYLAAHPDNGPVRVYRLAP